MDSRFEKLRKIAMEEFGVTIKPSNRTMTFESLFGVDARKLPEEPTVLEEAYTKEQCFVVEETAEHIYVADNYTIIAA